MIEHNDEMVQTGKKPRYGFSIKAEPNIIQEVMQIPNQIPTPVGLFLPFGSEKQYLQTWSNDISLRDNLLSLGLREIQSESPEGTRFLLEWTRELNAFVKQSFELLRKGFADLSGS